MTHDPTLPRSPEGVIAALIARYGLSGALAVETYTYTLHDAGGALTWDITAAKAWVAAQPAPATLEVPPDQLAHIASTWEVDEAAAARADPTQPGIAAPIIDRTQVPPCVVYILVDGVHRAVKAYRTGQRFAAYLLPDEVSAACLLDAPDGRVP